MTEQMQCVHCQKILDPRGEHTRLELEGGQGKAGFIVGHLCDDCAPEVAEIIDDANDDLGGRMP